MFIAIWDEEFGPKIVDINPEVEELDFNTISSHIFRTYQFFYKDEAESHSTRFLFQIPIVNITKKASICLDWVRYEEEGAKKQPFIVVILLPDYFPDESMKVFENIIQNIGMEYAEKKTPILKKYFHQVNEKFIIEQKVLWFEQQTWPSKQDARYQENWQRNFCPRKARYPRPKKQ